MTADAYWFLAAIGFLAVVLLMNREAIRK